MFYTVHLCTTDSIK